MDDQVSPTSQAPDAAGQERATSGIATFQGWLSPMLRRGFQLALLLALLVLTFRVVILFEIGAIWDDAYIFQRYCENLLEGHGWAWHRGGEPTYGTTSLGFVLPATLFRAITQNASLSAMLAGVSGGVVFVLLLAWSLRSAPGSRGTRAAAVLLAVLWCAKSGLPHHFASGMDTTWVLAFLAGYFWVLARVRQAPSRRNVVLLGVVGGLSFAMRPDLLVFTLGIPGAWLVLAHNGAARRRAGLILGITVAMTGLQLGFNAWYFQSALPLPFYAKSLGLYGGSLKRAYRAVSSEYLSHFVAAAWPLVALLGLDVLASPRRWWRQTHALDKAMLATTLFFGLYYWLRALPVMGFHQRFYQPLVVPMVWMAAYALDRWRRQMLPVEGAAQSGAAPEDKGEPDAVGAGDEQPQPAIALGLSLSAVVGLVLSLFLLFPEVAKHGPGFARSVLRRPPQFDIYKHASHKGPLSYWYKLDKVITLPDDMVIAATEVGMLAAVNREKRIIDMAGLNERAFALSPFDAERLLDEYRPDFIYMPHKDYDVMRKAMIDSPQWDNYVYFDYKRLRTKSFGVAIRKDSKHFREMRELLPGTASRAPLKNQILRNKPRPGGRAK